MLPHFAQVSWRPSEYVMLRDGALSRPTKYLMLQDEALWRATEYLLQLRKYYDGRQSTSAFCASIVTADRIPYAAGWNTMTADKVHYSIAKTLRRPTEYFRILRKHRGGRQNSKCLLQIIGKKLVKSFFLFFVFSFLFVLSPSEASIIAFCKKNSQNFGYIKRNPYLCNEISIIITNH